MAQPRLILRNPYAERQGVPKRTRAIDKYVADPEVILMRLPQWVVDDLGLEPRVAWKEDGKDVVRFSVDVELFGREGMATARLAHDDTVVLDRLAMMSLGAALDREGQLVELPEPYLRT